MAGENDDFISPNHSRQIHDVYAGDKNIIIVPGDHNSIRPRFMHDSVAIFLENTLQVGVREGAASSLLSRANVASSTHRSEQINGEHRLPGAAKFIGLPPWVRIGDGRFYYGEEEAVVDYWSDYLFDDIVGGSSPGASLPPSLSPSLLSRALPVTERR